MSTQLVLSRIEADAASYAASLHNHAACRLDSFSLRCWIIRRLMLDQGLGHDAAERTCDRVLSRAANAAAEAKEHELRRACRRGSLLAALREIPPHVQGKCAIHLPRHT
jgi:hypothetical protein